MSLKFGFRDQPRTNRVLRCCSPEPMTRRPGPTLTRLARSPSAVSAKAASTNVRHGVWVDRIMLGRKANGRPDRPKLTGLRKADVQGQLADLRLGSEQGQANQLTHPRAARLLRRTLPPGSKPPGRRPARK